MVSVPAAYALAKIRFIGRTSSIYFMLSTRVIPDIALVVPFFLFVQKLGLMDNLWALIITYLAITVPFSIFILTGYFESLPDELDKAARVDGCSRLQTLVLVYLPLQMQWQKGMGASESGLYMVIFMVCITAGPSSAASGRVQARTKRGSLGEVISSPE